MLTLLSNQTANGSGTAQEWSGGWSNFTVTGTFNGATVVLEMSRDGGTTYSTVATVTAAADPPNVQLPAGVLVRATLSSAGGSTDLDAVF